MAELVGSTVFVLVGKEMEGKVPDFVRFDDRVVMCYMTEASEMGKIESFAR